MTAADPTPEDFERARADAVVYSTPTCPTELVFERNVRNLSACYLSILARAEAAERKVEAWEAAIEQLALAIDYGLLDEPMPSENSARGNGLRIYLQGFRDAYATIPGELKP